MKTNIADRTKVEFDAAIREAIEDWKCDTKEETVHFTKNSKLDRVTMIKMLCLMGGNSLRKELHDYPEINVTASSFSERRAAIDSELMYYVLRRFSDTDSGNEKFLYKRIGATFSVCGLFLLTIIFSISNTKYMRSHIPTPLFLQTNN